jgi:hypothetical protein
MPLISSRSCSARFAASGALSGSKTPGEYAAEAQLPEEQRLIAGGGSRIVAARVRRDLRA